MKRADTDAVTCFSDVEYLPPPTVGSKGSSPNSSPCKENNNSKRTQYDRTDTTIAEEVRFSIKANLYLACFLPLGYVKR